MRNSMIQISQSKPIKKCKVLLLLQIANIGERNMTDFSSTHTNASFKGMLFKNFLYL